MSESNQRIIWHEKAQQGDPLAVAGLLAAMFPVLQARAKARMDPVLKTKLDPEDILQEVYLDVFRRIDHFDDRGPDSFGNWVLTILDSKLADAARALHRRKRDIAREVHPKGHAGSDSYGNLLDQLYGEAGSPSHVVRRDEALGSMLACMTRLPEQDQQVIRMRFLEGHSVREVAARLNATEAVVVAATKRALGALRKSMDQLGEFTHGA